MGGLPVLEEETRRSTPDHLGCSRKSIIVRHYNNQLLWGAPLSKNHSLSSERTSGPPKPLVLWRTRSP